MEGGVDTGESSSLPHELVEADEGRVGVVDEGEETISCGRCIGECLGTRRGSVRFARRGGISTCVCCDAGSLTVRLGEGEGDAYGERMFEWTLAVRPSVDEHLVTHGGREGLLERPTMAGWGARGQTVKNPRQWRAGDELGMRRNRVDATDGRSSAVSSMSVSLAKRATSSSTSMTSLRGWDDPGTRNQQSCRDRCSGNGSTSHTGG